MVTSEIFLHTEAVGQPSKKSKKGGAHGIVFPMIAPRESGKSAGSNGHSQVPEGTQDASRKNSGKEGSIAGESFKSANLRCAIHWLPNLRKERNTKP